MKILAASDIHNSWENFKPGNSDDFDVAVFAGDLTNHGLINQHIEKNYENVKNFQKAANNLRNWSNFANKVIWIPGNHDWNMSNIAVKETKNIYHKTIDINGLYFYGVSLGYYPDKPDIAVRWDHMTINPIYEEHYYLETIPKNVNVLVSHSPPTGITGTEKAIGNIGSPSLRKYIELYQPRLVICGHVHNPISRYEKIGRTEIYNVATIKQIIEI